MKMVNSFDIPISVDLVLGLPGDNLEGWRTSVQTTIDLRPQRFQSFLCSVLPGTHYDLKREEYGIQTLSGSDLDDDEKVVSTKSFTAEEMRDALDIESWLYFVFSINLCSDFIFSVARELGKKELEVVEDFRQWNISRSSILCNVIQGYRDNLYNSRQQGRFEVEKSVLENFYAIYQTLFEYADFVGASEKAKEQMIVQFLKFPKTGRVVEDLVASGLVEKIGDGDLVFRHNQQSWLFKKPNEEPIVGVIGTKYQYWTWEPQVLH